MFGRTLVLVPHRDDAVLGVGGTLSSINEMKYLFYFNDTHPLVDKSIYDHEAEMVRQTLNAFSFYSDYMNVNKLDVLPIHFYIAEIENMINTCNPDTVFIPCPDYNSDHRVVYNAAMTAIRTHDKNWYVKNVYLYEQPETHTPAYTTFIPQLFVPIDIDKKIELYKLYASQIRGHRSPEHLRFLAGMRGMQCNSEYAEAFQVVRETK